MNIELRFFASLREALGPFEALSVADGTTLGALRDQLIARGGRYPDVLARTRAVRCALNHTLCDETTAITDGAEVAFFPPVTGG